VRVARGWLPWDAAETDCFSAFSRVGALDSFRRMQLRRIVSLSSPWVGALGSLP